MDIQAVGLFDNPRAASPRSGRLYGTRLRGAKLVAAYGVAVLIGLGSYAASYKTLAFISASPASGSVVPAASGDVTTTTTLLAPAQPPS